MITPNRIVLDTRNLAFGQIPPQVIEIQLECSVDVVTETPQLSVTASECPFSVDIDSGVQKPILRIILDQGIDKVKTGLAYNVTINAAGNGFILPVTFMYAEDYVPQRFINSDGETTAGQAFSFRDILPGKKILSREWNGKMRMLLQYCALLYFRISDLASKFETRRKLKDIVDAAIHAGVFPKSTLTTVERDADGDVVIVNISYSQSEERFTRLIYTYEQLDVTIDYSEAEAPYTAAPKTSKKKFLSNIEIWRMSSDAQDAKLRYKICDVNFVRAQTTYDSPLGCKITMPLISSWVVSE